MKWNNGILAVLVLFALSTGCVSKKKYADMENLKNKIQDMLDQQKTALKDCETDKDSIAKALSACDDARLKLEADTSRLAREKRNLRDEIKNINSRCDQLSNNYDQLKSQSSKKIQELIDNLESLQKDLAAREARLAEVERRLNERDSVMNALRKKLEDALLGFRDQGLSVEIRNGKVYVSLSNKLLFASGSTKIDKNGQKALADLAAALKGNQDISIMVEGHTDNVKVTNLGDIKDNWDLSVMRSTEVVRLLVTSGIEPARIIPSGRGEFVPKEASDTPEARASNRRTEIIISPKLDELFEIIGK